MQSAALGRAQAMPATHQFPRPCPAAAPSARATGRDTPLPFRTTAATAAAANRAPAHPQPPRRRRVRLPIPAASSSSPGPQEAGAAAKKDDNQPETPQERKEYYDPREMPPLPLTVARITLPSLDHVVVDPSTEATRLASLAVFTEMWRDEQYGGRLDRRSAITALCMYDRDDVAAARAKPGLYPNIDVLERIYREGLEVEVVVEEK